MVDSALIPEKSQVRAAFNRSARNYDGVAVLQREVGDRLLERLDLIRLQPKTILDIGSGTGYISDALTRRYRKAQVISLDLADNMLRLARKRQGWFSRQRFVCGDAESLPLADGSVDMIVSNLTLQWCHDLDAVFAEFRRVLAPEGVVLFATLGPDTLKELRRAWQAVDGLSHVNAFIEMHDVGDAMLRARLADPVMDVEHLTMTYGSVLAIMRDLKTLGAHNVTQGRARGLTGKNHLAQMIKHYEQFRRDGVLPVTYEVVYGNAWRAQLSEGTNNAGPKRVAFQPLAKP